MDAGKSARREARTTRKRRRYPIAVEIDDRDLRMLCELAARHGRAPKFVLQHLVSDWIEVPTTRWK